MEERRFDAWTRTLGAATSRRQVLKGVLGGVLAAVVGRVAVPTMAEAAEVCDRHACEQEVQQYFANCLQACAISGAFRGTRDPRKKAFCRTNCYFASKALGEDCKHNATGCFGSDQVCCNQQCTNLQSDPNNCGACGHACPEGRACVDGQCQCEDEQTYCENQCVNTQTDNTNCGSCGHACSSCETCLGGECQPLNCGSGQVCCQHLCIPECQGGPPDPNTCLCDVCDGQANGLSCGPEQVCCDQHCMSEACPDGKTFDLNRCDCECTPISCPDGQTQDPTTCQCVSICTTATDGTACGPNMECCQQQCVSTACPAGRTFSPDTCQCECTPIDCPDGQTQSPLTCQCSDTCVGVTCDTCKTCDPDSGQCVQAPAGTSCGSNLTCCADGTCKANCEACPDDRMKCGDTCCPTNEVCGNNDTCQQPGGCDVACGPDEICCQGYGIEGDFEYGCVSVSEYKICPVVASNQAGATRGSWTCCPIDLECCGGSGYFYNICGGEDAEGVHTCCKPPQTECGPYCCESHANCFSSFNLNDYCCPADSGGVLDDGTCCSPGTQPTYCADTSEACLVPGDYC